jgi:hypothetical protein
MNKYYIAEGDFPFQFYIEKAVPVDESETKDMEVEGIASTSNVDHDNERMAPSALKAMANIINKEGVPLRIEHSKDDNAVIGAVYKAWFDGRGQLWIRSKLNSQNEVAKLLHKALKDGTKMGLSVGGKVKKAVREISDGIGKEVKTFYDVDLQEVSVTQRPANYDAWLVAKHYKLANESAEPFYKSSQLRMEFLFENPQLDYVQVFQKSIPNQAWKKVGEDNISNNVIMKKFFGKEESSEETKKEESSSETEKEESTDETKKEQESSEETKKEESTESTEKEESDESKEKATSDDESMGHRINALEESMKSIVKTMNDGFSAIAKAVGTRRDGQENTEGDGDVDKEESSSETEKEESSNDETEKEESSEETKKEESSEETKKEESEADETKKEESETETEKEETHTSSDYDMEPVQRAIKAIEKSFSINKSSKKVAGNTLDMFTALLSAALENTTEKFEKSGMSIPGGIRNMLIDRLVNNSEFQKAIKDMMKEPGIKKSVSVAGTPFVRGKDGKMYSLGLKEVEIKKSENQSTKEDFKSVYKKNYSGFNNPNAS